MSLSLWRRAFAMASGQTRRIVVVVLLTLCIGVLGACEPLLLQRAIDSLVAGGGVATPVLAFALLHLTREGLNANANSLTWRTRMDVHYGLLDASVSKLHALPLSYHTENEVGAVMTKLDRGISGVVSGLSEIAFSIMPSCVYVVVALASMSRLNATGTLLVVAFLPVPAAIGAWAVPKQVRRERELLGRWSRIYGRFNEVLSGIVTVKSFAMEDREKERFLSGVSNANEEVVRGVKMDSWISAGKNSSVALARAAALAWGGYCVVHGQMTVGAVVAFMAYVAGLFGPMQGLVSVYQSIRKTEVALDSVFALLDARDTLGDAAGARELPALRGEVEFDRVSFSYDGKRPVLRDVSFRVKAGETVALVGGSGAGKTTLISTLQRLYDPTSGAIRIDGHDLRELKQRWLRAQIGIVPQDGVLFNDCVASNIAYGVPNASRQAIETAAKLANAHDFILQLPRGYDTPVGERGKQLSTGQRQRIAIARAILKDPAMIILDEATSALDAESEAAVSEALARLTRGRTTFIIAHRLSTIMHADRIIVLQDGHVIEAGKHDELLMVGGLYARLFHRGRSSHLSVSSA